MSVPTEKTALRTEVLRRRATVSLANPLGFAEALRDGSISFASAASVETPVVSVFLPIRGEPDTEPLIEALVAPE